MICSIVSHLSVRYLSLMMASLLYGAFVLIPLLYSALVAGVFGSDLQSFLFWVPCVVLGIISLLVQLELAFLDDVR